MIFTVTQNENLTALTSSCHHVRGEKYQGDLRNNSPDFFTPEIHDEVEGCCRKAHRVKEGDSLPRLSSLLHFSFTLSHFPDPC